MEQVKLIPLFRTHSGREFVGEGQWRDGWPCIAEDDGVMVYSVEMCEPITIAAVHMYEACGGSLETATRVASQRRGPRPAKLFARAHAYAAMKDAYGEGC